MLDIQASIARNLKQLRENRKLSLDAVARATGVSKSMLAQIERGDVNPTVSTVWKITNGLKLSFTSLISWPESEVQVVHKTDVTPMLEDDGHYRIFAMFPLADTRRFEMYSVELDPGSHLDAEAHPDGTEEFITVFSGALTVTVRGETLRVEAGSSVRFRADTAHAYDNTEAVQCLLSMVIHYRHSW